MTFDEAVDELYSAERDAFVATRTRLAKELGGDEGKELARLRKPTVAAWALNRLSRDSRRDVDLLLDAGHRMRQAGADRTAFDEARAKETDALRRLTQASEALGIGPAAVAKVNAALRAAAVTEDGREHLARGRFVDLPEATGFEAYTGVELPKLQRHANAPKRDHTELRVVQAELRELERRHRAAQAEADALAEQVAAAERRVRKLSM